MTPPEIITEIERNMLRATLREVLDRAKAAEARVATLEVERDKAREDCGHQRAMRESIRAEMERYIQMRLDCKKSHGGGA